jgi:hypothetical protein
LNIRIEYFYRDGSNYKRWTEVVFVNPKQISIAKVWSEIVDATQQWRLFADTVHFRPELVSLETCYFTDIGYSRNGDDFELHEMHRIVDTQDRNTDSRTIEEFLGDLRRAGLDCAMRPTRVYPRHM